VRHRKVWPVLSRCAGNPSQSDVAVQIDYLREYGGSERVDKDSAKCLVFHWQADSICGIRYYIILLKEPAFKAGISTMSDTSFLEVGDLVAIASDHAGFALKTILKGDLHAMGLSVVDLGPEDETSVDYPDFGQKLAKAVAEGLAKAGVLVCGTGIGISIAANREPRVRARAHNDANVMAVGARVTEEETARACLKTFFNTPFEGGRHARRVEKLGAA
jgi:ribose 5-phosphate isomerase B